jgi:ubiquinone/menaquinone biosynthesis C-methylase UbiE
MEDLENEKNILVRTIPDPNDYIRMLEVFHPLRESILRSAIEMLQLPAGSQGLDAGCGIGLPSLLLAESVGPDGHVTGLDVSAAFLNYAKDVVEQAGLAEQISFREGNINHLPFANKTFDWVWSVDCAGYRTEDPLPLFRELTRVIKPGGILALLCWSSEKLLPGYPLLEARLNTTAGGIAPFTMRMQPETHYLRTLKWMHEVGLTNATGHTVVGNVQAPLHQEIRQALFALFQMRWAEAESEVSQEVWREYQRLCQPESPDCILDLPEYYAFFTYTMFYGKTTK